MVMMMMMTYGEVHGHRSWGRRGDKSPRIWSEGIVPPDFVMLQNFKHQITCVTMYRKMCFCLYSRTFIVSSAMRLPEFQSDLRLYGEVLTHGLDS